MAEGAGIRFASKASRAVDARIYLLRNDEHAAGKVAAVDSALGHMFHGGQLKGRKLIGIHMLGYKG
jgi:hypothetical protein